MNAIDAALDGIVQLFYLRREGFAVDGTPYAQRRLDRAEAVFGWLGKELAPDKCSFDGGLGLAEIALVPALDWMDFREALPHRPRLGARRATREMARAPVRRRDATFGLREDRVAEPVYLIAQIETEDLPRYRAEYGQRVLPLIAEHGGVLLVGSDQTETLEGTWSANWTVVIRFPSREAALAWYGSAAYAPLKRARLETLASGSNLVLVPGRT